MKQKKKKRRWEKEIPEQHVYHSHAQLKSSAMLGVQENNPNITSDKKKRKTWKEPNPPGHITQNKRKQRDKHQN